MANALNILISGFGGQGVLFAGKFLVYLGLVKGRQVSWLPSYGPEMRGGTASVSVIISDEPVGSPIVSKPNLLIAMNLPSIDRYEDACVPGATVICDSSLIPRKLNRTDVRALYIPASTLAEENGLKGLANMIIAGLAARETELEDLDYALKKTVPEKKAHLFGANKTALELGFNYGRQSHD
ncbi:MAG: 2-oxoacid:acceptor oxidoreductase family protein [Clostridiales bacterium]|jgi:2-oxoglutarate ferredoxin oxidoreductase subunit gamma|nr:2-oxoacid:acceptor oxidoreductase family protein [Clostridiales bacterium]